MKTDRQLNKKSFASLAKGLKQAAAGEFAPAPELPDLPEQEISSAGTCVKKMPAAYRALNEILQHPENFWLRNRDVLDYGGGKYDVLGDELAKTGVRTYVLDPYNRSADHNSAVRKLLEASPADMAFCSCVLNVIREPAARVGVLENIAQLTAAGGYVVFSVYEGDKSGRGKRTTRGWQNNRSLKSYVREIRKIFDIAVVDSKIIIAIRRRR